MKNKVKSIRKKYGISTREFARRLGVSHRTVEGWEQGRTITPQTKLFINVMFNGKITGGV